MQLSNRLLDNCPWGHITVFLDRLDDHELRNWYAGQAAAHGWSRNVLAHQIRTAAHTRLQAAPTNFAEVLPPGDSDLAQQITKDPCVLDFLALALALALARDAKERHLEQALVDRIIDTLRELGDTTRSLLAAARTLGFTLPELAALTGVSEGSVRNRSNVVTPVAPRRFHALLPEHDQGAPHTLAGAEYDTDPVRLLAEYLGAVFVADTSIGASEEER